MRRNGWTTVREIVEVLISGVVGILLVVLLDSCSRTVYVPVESETVRTDTLYVSKVRVDSVRQIERVYESDRRYDSVAPILDSLNRVIGWDRYHFHESTKKDSREIDRLKALVDSLRAARRDSVDRAVPYPVEREQSRWEQAKMDFGGMAIGAIVIVLCAAVVWLIKKFR